MEKVAAIFTSTNLWVSLGFIAIGVVMWLGIGNWSKKLLSKMDITDKNATYVRFIESSLRFLVAAVVILSVLQQNGINLTSVATGLGVAGIVVGFALQDILKDIIMGVNIVWDRYFSIDDVVRYNDIEGLVIFHNLKVTKIQDMDSGAIHTVSNRNISEIEKLSDRLDIKIPAPYSVPAVTMRKVCEEIASRMRAMSYVTGCEFLGTDAFEESSITYLCRIFCSPIYRHEVRRAALGAVQDVLSEHGIDIPFRQLDVHLDSVIK